MGDIAERWWKKRRAGQFPLRLILVAATLMLVASIAPASFGQERNVSVAPKAYFAEHYCEPECSEAAVKRPSRTRPETWSWDSDITPKCFVAVLIAGFLGFALARFTVSPAPSANDVDVAIGTETADRQAEAMRHGVAATAGPLLAQLDTQARNAVKKLLPAPQTGGLLALVLAAVLVFVFLLIPVTPPNCRPDCPPETMRSEAACGICS